MRYLPAESDTGMFGGNSNWRGPVWMPVNGLIVRGLLNLLPVLRRRLDGRVPDRLGPADEPVRGGRGDRAPARRASSCATRRPAARLWRDDKFQDDPHWRDLILFYEYFHGDNGAGLGASHQTGWTGIISPAPAICSAASTAKERSRPARAPRRREARSASRSAASEREARMTCRPRYPSLYQINTRVWLTELSRRWAGAATLDDIPDAELDRLAEMGFDWVWFLSVWQTGPAARRSRAATPSGARNSRRRCPTCATKTSRVRLRHHRLHASIDDSRRRRRARPAARSGCTKRGLRLMLDFVPNHMAPRSPVGRGPSRSTSSRGTRTRPGAAPRRTTPGSNASAATGCSPTAATRTSPAGPTRCSSTTATRPAGSDDRRAVEDRRAMRRRALRHGHARAARGLRADLGHRVGALLADARPRRVRERSPGLPLHGRGLLGPGMDAAAAGLRLRLRQAAVRPARTSAGSCGARALHGGTRLPGQPGPLPGKPRRAARGGDVRPRRPPRRGRHHVSVARAPVLPSGAVRRKKKSGFRRTSAAVPRSLWTPRSPRSTTG